MNNTEAQVLWFAINFLWSGVLTIASVWLYVIARQIEFKRQLYGRWIRRTEQKQRNERKL